MIAHRRGVTCRGTAKHVTENLDRLLGRRVFTGIRSHLDGCPNCAAYLDSLKKTVTLYRFFPRPKLPSSTRKKLLLVLKIS